MTYRITQLWLWFIITCLVVLLREVPYLGVALVILGITMWAVAVCDNTNPSPIIDVSGQLLSLLHS